MSSSNLFHNFLNEIGKGVYVCFSGIDISILLWFIFLKQNKIHEEFINLNTSKIQFFKSKIRCRRNSVCDNIYLIANRSENTIIFNLSEKKIHKEFNDNTYTYILCHNNFKLLQTNKFIDFRSLNREKTIQNAIKYLISKFGLANEINMYIFCFLYPYDLENVRLLPLI